MMQCNIVAPEMSLRMLTRSMSAQVHSNQVWDQCVLKLLMYPKVTLADFLCYAMMIFWNTQHSPSFAN